MTLLDPIINFLVTCGRKTISLGQVVAGAQRERKQVLRVMDKLTREGYLEETSDDPVHLRSGEYGPPRRNPTWKIVKDLDARPKPNPPKEKSSRSKVWTAIRAKRIFTKRDLVITSGASAATVDEYVRKLKGKGYVRETLDQHGRPCRDGRSVVYQLIKRNQVDPPTGLFTEVDDE